MKSAIEIEITLENLERDIWNFQDDIRDQNLSIATLKDEISENMDSIKDLNNKFESSLSCLRETLERQINMLEDRIDALHNRLSDG
jgi:predicted  nucleic acid-binding Zn-ribbon protein